MIGIATGRGTNISFDKHYEVCKWLANTYGPESKDIWYEEQDYDLTGIVMSEEAYLMYKLRFK